MAHVTSSWIVFQGLSPRTSWACSDSWVAPMKVRSSGSDGVTAVDGLLSIEEA